MLNLEVPAAADEGLDSGAELLATIAAAKPARAAGGVGDGVTPIAIAVASGRILPPGSAPVAMATAVASAAAAPASLQG